VAQGVLDQRATDLKRPLGVGQDDRVLLDCQLERVVGGQCHCAELVHERARHRGQLEGLALDSQAPRIEPRQVEQIGGELLEPLHLLAHRVEELVARLLVEVLVPEELEEPAEREERRPELV
jgi:hypothetical protein